MHLVRFAGIAMSKNEMTVRLGHPVLIYTHSVAFLLMAEIWSQFRRTDCRGSFSVMALPVAWRGLASGLLIGGYDAVHEVENSMRRRRL
jgi:hypothetical protein